MLCLGNDPILFSSGDPILFSMGDPILFSLGDPILFFRGEPPGDRAWAFPNFKFGGNVIPYLGGGIMFRQLELFDKQPRHTRWMFTLSAARVLLGS